MASHSLAKKIGAIILLAGHFGKTHTLDRVHFYAANRFWEEPRLEKPYLLSTDLAIWRGSTCEGRDACRCTKDCKKPNILNIYGTYNMHALGKNVPDKDPTKPENIVLDNLQQIEAKDCFGHLSFTGKFRMAGGEMLLTQNFKRGFFIQLHLPIRCLEVRNICYTDLSSSGPASPNKTEPEWQEFLAAFRSILTLYDLNISSFKKTSAGDISLLVGWTRNYEDTERLDFVDWTIKTGVLFPSGKKRNPNKVFSIPTGYDGHWGIPISFDLSIGLYEWITLGTHLHIIPLLKRIGTVRMKTAPEQSGMIKLAKGTAKIKSGLVTQVGLFAQADHIISGLSLTTGYSYAYQGNKKICPCETEKFNSSVVNNDEMFKKWSVHTIHFKVDYDFTKEKNRIGSRLGIFVDWHVGGKRTFKTNRFGPQLGLDFLLEV